LFRDHKSFLKVSGIAGQAYAGFAKGCPPVDSFKKMKKLKRSK
jgi:hypothetical protein